jgi:hypothetical protein
MQRTITHPLAGNATSGSLEPSSDTEDRAPSTGPSYVDSVLFGRRRTSPGSVSPELGVARMRRSDKADARGAPLVAERAAREANEQERS